MSGPPDLPEALVAKFLEAVGVGDRESVDAMLAATPALVNAVGPHPFWGGRPQALHVAIDTDRHHMALLLLRAGADVDGDNDGYMHWSPLLLATQKRRTRTRRALLRHGAKVGLAEALAMGDDTRVMKLLERGRAALAIPTPGGGSLLCFARTPAAIDRLLELGVATDAEDHWGATPMEALSRLGPRGKRLVRHLHARGVAVGTIAFARLDDRRTLARLAATDPDRVRALGVLRAAVDFGHRELAAWLLDRGSDPNARTGEAQATCLHSAAWNGDLAMVDLLLRRGADPCLADRQYGTTPAKWAEVAADVTNNPACATVAERLRAAERG